VSRCVISFVRKWTPKSTGRAVCPLGPVVATSPRRVTAAPSRRSPPGRRVRLDGVSAWTPRPPGRRVGRVSPRPPRRRVRLDGVSAWTVCPPGRRVGRVSPRPPGRRVRLDGVPAWTVCPPGRRVRLDAVSAASRRVRLDGAIPVAPTACCMRNLNACLDPIGSAAPRHRGRQAAAACAAGPRRGRPPRVERHGPPGGAGAVRRRARGRPLARAGVRRGRRAGGAARPDGPKPRAGGGPNGGPTVTVTFNCLVLIPSKG
jgi:hypothetical protein